MLKKVCFLLVVILIMAAISPAVGASGQDITVKIDGNTVTFPDAKPFIQVESGRTMVPIRFIAENLGCQVDWNSQLKAVYITKDYKNIKLIIGQSEALVNNETKVFDATAVIKEDRTFVPLRFISETLKAQVEWVEETRIVNIKTYQEDPNSFIEPQISVKYAKSKEDPHALELQLDNWGDYTKDYSMRIHFTSHPLNEVEFLNFDDTWHKVILDYWHDGIGNTIFQLHKTIYTTRENAFELKNSLEIKYVFYLKKKSTGEIREYPGSVIVKILE